MRSANRFQKKFGISGYHVGKDMPLGSYAIFVGVFNALFGALLRGSGKGEAPAFKDLALLALSTHKVSRVLTKDAVMAPFRAPFTRYKEDLGYGELSEQPRGRGMRQAVGELLSCNYCADMWIGLAGLAALRRFPRQSRLAMSLFASVTAADFLHVAYESTRTQANVLTLEEESRAKSAA